MLKTVRCYVMDEEDSEPLWSEMVTYDTDYWEYNADGQFRTIHYLGKSSQVPKKPEGLFHCCYTFYGYGGTHLDLSNFDTTNVIDMRGMFSECTSLQSLNLFNFDTSNVTDMVNMFSGCVSLKSLDLSSFDTANVTDMHDMFSGCKSLQSLDLSSFNTSNVTNMYFMFYFCKSLQSLDLSSFNTSNVTYMDGMFSDCDSLNSLDLSKFDTSNVIAMSSMFKNCKSLKSLDLSSFDTSKVTNMWGMFSRCKSLQSLDLSSFDTSNVTDMFSMFGGCESLNSLDLSSFDTSNIMRTGMDDMFARTNLTKEITGLGLFNKKPKKPIRQSMKLKGNVSLDDISKEIDRVYHGGNIPSSKVLINSLRDSGFSDSNIVSCIFNRVESGFLDRDIYMPIVNSYIEKCIQPEIVKNLSSKSVGEVLDILYSRYHESIVNKAMCMYLRPQYLVD